MKAKNPILPEAKEIVWAVISFVIVFALLAWKAWPAIKKALKDREDRIRGDLERAEQARIEAETSLDGVPAAARRGTQPRPAQIIEEAASAAEQVRQELHRRGRGEIAEHPGSRPQEDIRLATERAMADLQGRVAELSIELAEKVVEQQPRPRHADPPHRELHQPGREQLTDAVESTASRRTRTRMLEVARAEGTLGDVEDELFRFARAFESSDELRMTLTDASAPAERRVAVVEDLLTRQGAAGERRARGVHRRPPAGRASCPRSSTGSSSSRRPSTGARSPRSAPRWRSTPEQTERLRDGARTRPPGKEVEVKVVRRPQRARRRRRPRR